MQYDFEFKIIGNQSMPSGQGVLHAKYLNFKTLCENIHISKIRTFEVGKTKKLPPVFDQKHLNMCIFSHTKHSSFRYKQYPCKVTILQSNNIQ